MKNPSFRMMDTGVSMLIPQAYEPFWTRLDDGTFNDYPPQSTSPLDGVLSGNTQIDSDATFAQYIPIPFTTIVSQSALVAANARRGFLLIQNNSAIGAAGDVLPNLYVSYDGPVSAPLQLNLTIAPGSGIVLDRRPPGNAIYIRWGTFTNTSGTAVAGGVLHQGLLPVR
jgi:hypothetical protein